MSDRHEIIIPELDEIIEAAKTSPSREGLPWSPGDIAVLKKYYRQPGVNLRKISKALNRPYSAVQTQITRLGLSEEIPYPEIQTAGSVR